MSDDPVPNRMPAIRRILMACAILMSASPVLALDERSPHWFGIGSGIVAGSRSRTVFLAEGGRLIGRRLGFGGLVLVPTENRRPDRPDLTACATIDRFFRGGAYRLSLLAGAESYPEEAPDRLAFLGGVQGAASLAWSPRWHLEARLAPFAAPAVSRSVQWLAGATIQLRY